MKEVKVMPKYKCDFCNKRSVKLTMLLHEKRCFRNPNRFCDYCENKGFTEEDYSDIVEGSSSVKVDCPYCSRFDKEKLKAIEKYEVENPK